MMIIPIIAVIAIIGYLLGSINTSIIISRFRGTDIRQHGSGNAGLTNTLRTFGAQAAVLTLLGDILKGVVAVWLVKYVSIMLCLILEVEVAFGTSFLVMLECVAGLACVLGHNFPIYFKFKGGKGVLTGAVVTGMIDWRLMVAALVVFIIVCSITRYVSLSSICGSLVIIVLSVILYFNQITTLSGISVILFSCIVGGMTIIRHHGNIKRLITGTERKLGEKRKA